jgi:hypothetical protein
MTLIALQLELDFVNISIVNEVDSIANISILLLMTLIALQLELDFVNISIVNEVDSIANISIIVNGINSIATGNVMVPLDIVNISIINGIDIIATGIDVTVVLDIVDVSVVNSIANISIIINDIHRQQWHWTLLTSVLSKELTALQTSVMVLTAVM